MGCSSSKGVRPHASGGQTPLAKQLLARSFDAQEEGVVVLVRLRPLNEKEKAEGGSTFLELQSNAQVVTCA